MDNQVDEEMVNIQNQVRAMLEQEIELRHSDVAKNIPSATMDQMAYEITSEVTSGKTLDDTIPEKIFLRLNSALVNTVERYLGQNNNAATR
jgi:hypothetical protein